MLINYLFREIPREFKQISPNKAMSVCQPSTKNYLSEMEDDIIQMIRFLEMQLKPSKMECFFITVFQIASKQCFVSLVVTYYNWL